MYSLATLWLNGTHGSVTWISHLLPWAIYIFHWQDCWKYVTPRKGVWPKLWSLLQQGGGGSATAIYPSMLPLLSQIPEDVIGEHLKFYQEFFRNFREGYENSIASYLFMETQQLLFSQGWALRSSDIRNACFPL